MLVVAPVAGGVLVGAGGAVVTEVTGGTVVVVVSGSAEQAVTASATRRMSPVRLIPAIYPGAPGPNRA